MCTIRIDRSRKTFRRFIYVNEAYYKIHINRKNEIKSISECENNAAIALIIQM